MRTFAYMEYYALLKKKNNWTRQISKNWDGLIIIIIIFIIIFCFQSVKYVSYYNMQYYNMLTLVMLNKLRCHAQF